MRRFVVEIVGTARTVCVVDANTLAEAETKALKRTESEAFAYRPSRWIEVTSTTGQIT